MADKKVNWWHPATDRKTRESPDDFMKAYSKWQHETGQTEKKVQLTPKAFAILRGQKQNEEKDN